MDVVNVLFFDFFLCFSRTNRKARRNYRPPIERYSWRKCANQTLPAKMGTLPRQCSSTPMPSHWTPAITYSSVIDQQLGSSRVSSRWPFRMPQGPENFALNGQRPTFDKALRCSVSDDTVKHWQRSARVSLRTQTRSSCSRGLWRPRSRVHFDMPSSPRSSS